MNRIILIGNGFDLAHNLETKYSDFLNHLWMSIIDEAKESIKLNHTNTDFMDVNKLLHWDFKYITLKGFQGTYSDIKKRIKGIDNNHKFSSNFAVIFENKFFELLTRNFTDGNWVDIETLYYEELKKNKNSQQRIDKLNLDFKKIKELLEEYLSDIESKNQNVFSDQLYETIRSEIVPRELSIRGSKVFFESLFQQVKELTLDEKEHDKWTDRDLPFYYEDISIPFYIDTLVKFFDKNREIFVHSAINLKSEDISFIRHPKEILFLTFNYTKTLNKYSEESPDPRYSDTRVRINHIHGKIGDPKNSIIFGYGDEHDDEYTALEKAKSKGIEGVLENIKSMKYSLTSNYRDFERFLDSDVYQVFIMGHSCGLTDKTLLKTLFEHDNCVSIKPYYYQSKKNEEGKVTDNFTEIIENISRCFDNKSLMRSRIVAKTLCEPLPQINK